MKIAIILRICHMTSFGTKATNIILFVTRELFCACLALGSVVTVKEEWS